MKKLAVFTLYDEKGASSQYRAYIFKEILDSMDARSLSSALQTLSYLLHKHYGQKTIIIIDEYDVPLDKAFQHGYYREMVALILLSIIYILLNDISIYSEKDDFIFFILDRRYYFIYLRGFFCPGCKSSV